MLRHPTTTKQARMAALKEEEQDRMSRSVVGGGAGRRRSSSSAATGAEYTEPIEKGRRTRHKDSNVSKTGETPDYAQLAQLTPFHLLKLSPSGRSA